MKRIIHLLAALAGVAALAPPAVRAYNVQITGACGDVGFIGLVNDGPAIARFHACQSGDVVTAELLDGAGVSLIRYTYDIELDVSQVWVDSLYLDPARADEDYTPAEIVRYLAVVQSPLGATFAALPFALEDLGIQNAPLYVLESAVIVFQPDDNPGSGPPRPMASDGCANGDDTTDQNFGCCGVGDKCEGCCGAGCGGCNGVCTTECRDHDKCWPGGPCIGSFVRAMESNARCTTGRMTNRRATCTAAD